MATRFIFLPNSAEFPAAAFPAVTLINRRPVLAFDASTNETAQWSAVAPVGLTGTLTADVYLMMASATSGDTDWDGSIEAVTSGDATDLDAGDSFATINSTDNTTVPATAGFMQKITITLTNNDSIAAGDYFRFKLTRDAASDTGAGDAYVLAVAFADAA